MKDICGMEEYIDLLKVLFDITAANEVTLTLSLRQVMMLNVLLANQTGLMEIIRGMKL